MTTSLSRNYARAMFDLAVESGTADAVEADLRSAREALFDPREVRAFLANRLVSRVTKKRLVAAAFESKVDPRLLAMLYLLVERGRAHLLGEITEEFERLHRRARGVQKVTLYSAFPLGEEERGRALRALEARLGSRVDLEVEVRPALVGGVVAVSEGREIEFSVQGRLQQIESELRAAAGVGPRRG